MKARVVADRLVEAFIAGQPTDTILTDAPQETIGIATALARSTAEQVRHHARRYAEAPGGATWVSIPLGIRPLVERYIKARQR